MFFILVIALVMDPLCKMQYIESIFTKYEDGDGDFQNGAILEPIRSLYADYVNRGVDCGNLN